MATLRRRLLDFLPRLGINVTNVAPGTVVLSRRGGMRARDLGPGAWLLTYPKKARRHLWDLQKGWYRYLTPEHVAWILRAYDVNCVIDVGANTGQYAKSLRRAGYRGRIASFEPLPHIAAKLETAAADDPEWLVYPYALGKEDTSIPMHVVHGTMSSLLPPSDFGNQRYKRFEEERLEEVGVRRLDGLLDEILSGLPAPRPYLKLDTQGYDLEAFAGLGARVGEFVGMQSEVALVRIYEGMPRMPQAVETYESAGFEITGMFPVSREKSTGRVLEYDCVMVRPDALPSADNGAGEGAAGASGAMGAAT